MESNVKWSIMNLLNSGSHGRPPLRRQGMGTGSLSQGRPRGVPPCPAASLFPPARRYLRMELEARRQGCGEERLEQLA